MTFLLIKLFGTNYNYNYPFPLIHETSRIMFDITPYLNKPFPCIFCIFKYNNMKNNGS